jgi:hypothetical protein
MSMLPTRHFENFQNLFYLIKDATFSTSIEFSPLYLFLVHRWRCNRYNGSKRKHSTTQILTIKSQQQCGFKHFKNFSRHSVLYKSHMTIQYTQVNQYIQLF